MGITANVINSVSKVAFKSGLVITHDMDGTDYKRNSFVSESGDYVRISELDLLAHEINERGVKGNVAEAGVFKGEFARFINAAFPDRKLYLFDTFESYDSRDTAVNKKSVFFAGKRDFSAANVEFVLGKMKYRDNCIVKKGRFPENTKDVDDTFAFVSIDTDWVEPVYDKMCYFYPKMSRGGGNDDT